MLRKLIAACVLAVLLLAAAVADADPTDDYVNAQLDALIYRAIAGGCQERHDH